MKMLTDSKSQPEYTQVLAGHRIWVDFQTQQAAVQSDGLLSSSVCYQKPGL